MKTKNFKDGLKIKMDDYVHFIYRITKIFPKDELYGVTSQIRRASLSIILNYIEGFARRRPAVQLNFLEISYGSLKESKYLLYFSYKEGYTQEEDYKFGLKLAEEIGAMLWTEVVSLEKSINK
ncbi:four helix bundle protein [Patescibacteria group bacterium]|nr:four helix bundle protein [Patescibacteria group bacterium]